MCSLMLQKIFSGPKGQQNIINTQIILREYLRLIKNLSQDAHEIERNIDRHKNYKCTVTIVYVSNGKEIIV